MSQRLQDIHRNDVAEAFLLLCTNLQWLKERERLGGLLLGQQHARSCHILAFTCQWGRHAALLREFLCPEGGMLHSSTCQPEPDPIHDKVDRKSVRVGKECRSRWS